MKRFAILVVGILFPVFCHAGGGDPGDFGDGVVLTPYLRTPFPYISLRNCWTEYKPLIRYNGETWEISWQAVEVCE